MEYETDGASMLDSTRYKKTFDQFWKIEALRNADWCSPQLFSCIRALQSSDFDWVAWSLSRKITDCVPCLERPGCQIDHNASSIEYDYC